MNNIKKFIDTYYDTIFQSDFVSELDEAEFFLLAGSHRETVDSTVTIGDSKIHSLFVNTFACSEDTVLVQDIPSMKDMLHPKEHRQAVWLNEGLQILGWDIKDLWKRLPKFLQQDYSMQAWINLIVKKIEASNQPRSINFMRQVIYDTIGAPKLFMLFVMLCQNRNESDEQYESAMKVKKVFCERVNSMRNTLMRIRDSKKNGRLKATVVRTGEEVVSKQRRVFLITDWVGKIVVDEVCNKEDRKAFEDFLKKNKVVVLVPKEEKAEEMGKENQILEEFVVGVIQQEMIKFCKIITTSCNNLAELEIEKEG